MLIYPINYFVYILTNKHSTVFYVGVTSTLVKRVYEHIDKIYPYSFTAKYNIYKLVYYEVHEEVLEAIAREKVIKKWRRDWKLNLIKKENPELQDIFTYPDPRESR